ncbi:putative lipase 2 [Neofusicoccum parvum]|uniref:Lipase 2 n=1 Tax=Neofusicoccum parvum TaxID=310453 RepID=A0ACB5S121_9PEZI|nr:putative lipase 2 [Neofusicoccum parvum]GME42842.1 putative lipase 2 [Neofusicoccum parvum]
MAEGDWTKLSEIDPEFKKLLEETPPLPGLGDGQDIPALRERLSAAKRDMNAKLLGSSSAGVDISDNVIPARDGFNLLIRIYKPSSPPPGGSPLAVILHGGGFCLGGLENEELTCRNFAKELGCVVVNVDYRLAPEHPFPAAVQDSWDAVKWAATNASSLGANPSKGFVVGGTSAGGNLSAVVGTLARDDKLSPPLTGLLLLVPSLTNSYGPPLKYKPELQSFDQNKSAPILDKKAIDTFFSAYNPDRDSRLFNLYTERDPVSRAGLPPVYFQVCGLDPLRDEALIFERELRTEHGTPTKLQLYPGLPHSFWSFYPQLQTSKKWVRDTLEGMKWLLEREEK